MVRDIIRAEWGITVGRRQASRLLNRLGYRHGRLRATYTLTEERRDRIELFIDKYLSAIKRAEESNCVVVYLDESFVNTRHSPSRGWTPKMYNAKRVNNDNVSSAPTEKRGDRKSNKGQRLIMIHAMTRDGLLCKRVLDGDPSSPYDANVARQPLPKKNSKGIQFDLTYLTAGWLFSADSRPKDYHKNVCGQMFMRYVRKQLIPTFQSVYGKNKKMVLYLDNAPYHHSRSGSQLNLKQMNKTIAVDPCNHLCGGAWCPFA